MFARELEGKFCRLVRYYFNILNSKRLVSGILCFDSIMFVRTDIADCRDSLIVRNRTLFGFNDFYRCMEQWFAFGIGDLCGNFTHLGKSREVRQCKHKRKNEEM